jgi:hypothetical protein
MMKYNEKQNLVLQWIESGCDFEQGTLLYGKFGKNKSLKTYFLGKNETYVTKLTYELCKSVALNYTQLQKDSVIPTIRESNHAQTPISEPIHKDITSEDPPVEIPALAEMPEVLSATNIAEYPPIIRRIIAEYAETFQERSKTHRILTEMPQGNSQALKTKRAEIFDLVKSFTVRLEYLYKIRQQYEQNGELPLEVEVWPKPKELAETTLTDDPEELRKMKKNQQTANTKDQNMLDYQTMVKGDEKKTMPSGPKRTRIENRIKGRLKFIQEIDLKLVSLNAN